MAAACAHCCARLCVHGRICAVRALACACVLACIARTSISTLTIARSSSGYSSSCKSGSVGRCTTLSARDSTYLAMRCQSTGISAPSSSWHRASSRTAYACVCPALTDSSDLRALLQRMHVSQAAWGWRLDCECAGACLKRFCRHI